MLKVGLLVGQQAFDEAQLNEMRKSNISAIELGEKNVDFIKKIGNKIITVHISDYDFKNERHWLPGEGDVDWQETYNALIESGYNGVWLYELPMKPKKTIIRRDLTYADIYHNAYEIMSGKKPTPIGQRVEGLVAWNQK